MIKSPLPWIEKGFQESLPLIADGAPFLFTALGLPWAGTAVAMLAKAFEKNPSDLAGISSAIANSPDSVDRLADAENNALAAIHSAKVKSIDLHVELQPDES